MKKVLFFAPYSFDKNKGYDLKGKFDGQMNALKELNYDVWYVGFKDNDMYLCNDRGQIKLLDCKRNSRNILKYDIISRNIKKIYQECNFDMCYIRYISCIPSFLRAIKFMKRNQTKIVIEIPTYPMSKERKSDKRVLFNLVFNLIEQTFSRYLYKYVDLYTLIGEKASSYNGVPAINIENCIDINKYKLKKINYKDNEIHILALAKMSYWHGYDRLIDGMNLYYSNNSNNDTNVILHLVGNDNDGSLSLWRESVVKYGLEDKVIFDGIKIGRDLDNIIDKCDIGVSSLGFYRMGIEAASSIKTSEYCARGIPFIYAGNQSLLDDNYIFAHKVPNDDTPIDINEIIDFALLMRNEQNIKKQMRDFAAKNMTWKMQFEKVIQMLE